MGRLTDAIEAQRQRPFMGEYRTFVIYEHSILKGFTVAKGRKKISKKKRKQLNLKNK